MSRPSDAAAPPACAVADGILHPLDRDPARAAALGEWLRLQAAFALCPERVVDVVRQHGGPGAALATVPIPSSARMLSGEASVDVLARSSTSALPMLAPAYPSRLGVLENPPLLLLVRGVYTTLSMPAVAIVGARAATAYGRKVARDLASALAAAGLAVISGLARGIDAAAHEGALDAGGRTIAVQACGPDRVYPREHGELAERICESGALVTELPPGTAPLAPFFPLRNRIISALARVVVVVEARPQSGSLITARHGADQGVDVMAVPGPITSPTSVGTNRLIADGAWPVLEPDDVLHRLGVDAPPPGARPAPAEELPTEEAVSEAALSGEGRRLLGALREQPDAADSLARRLAWPAQRVARVLALLELEGRVVLDRDGSWLASPRIGRD